MERELTSGVVYDELINPFPSLLTYPDVDIMQPQSHQCFFQHHQDQQQDQRASEDQTSMTKMVSPGGTPQQQWAANQQNTNIFDFIPQTSISPVESLETYSNTGQEAGLANVAARRIVLPPLIPAFDQIYSSPNGESSMSLSGDPRPIHMEDILKKIPTTPAVEKDGKQVIICINFKNSNFHVIPFINCVSIVALVVLHRFEDISHSRVCFLPGCWSSVW